MTDPRTDNVASEDQLMLSRYFKSIRDSPGGRCADCGQPLGDGAHTLVRENEDETQQLSLPELRCGDSPRRGLGLGG